MISIGRIQSQKKKKIERARETSIMPNGERCKTSPKPRVSPRAPCDSDVRQPPLRTQHIPPQRSRHPERDHRQQDRLPSPNEIPCVNGAHTRRASTRTVATSPIVSASRPSVASCSDNKKLSYAVTSRRRRSRIAIVPSDGVGSARRS